MLALLLACGTSEQKKSLEEIETAYESADFEETIALCRYAIRRGWDSARVHFYYGASLVALKRDYEGFRALDEAVGKDASIGVEAAALLHEMALENARSGQRATAARRMQKAIELDPSIDLGPYAFMVADAYFEAKRYGHAAPLYGEAIEAYPDTSILESAYFNMATSYDELDWNEQALVAYEKILELFPRGEHRSNSAWRVANIMFEQAEKEYVLGNYDEAVGILDELVRRTSNRGLLQKAHFLMGETYEAVEDYSAAYRAYREVINVDRGASGRIIERAREKITALQEAGLN